MSFLELAKARYSVRKFADKPIEPDKLERVLTAGNVAPTGCNYQPQRVYVVKNPEALKILNEQSRCIFGARTVLLFCLNTDEDWKNPLEAGVRAGIQDVSIVATHVMLAAWDEGLGTCWVNYFAPTKLKEALNLPANEQPVLLMPIGYPAPDAEPLHRMHDVKKPLSATVREI